VKNQSYSLAKITKSYVARTEKLACWSNSICYHVKF